MNEFYRGAADILEAIPPLHSDTNMKPTYVAGALAALCVAIETSFPGADLHQLLDVAKNMATEHLKPNIDDDRFG